LCSAIGGAVQPNSSGIGFHGLRASQLAQQQQWQQQCRLSTAAAASSIATTDEAEAVENGTGYGAQQIQVGTAASLLSRDLHLPVPFCPSLRSA
jgi:hypothetical protein